jgi:coenzyme F420-dependent glucose-6-phosphate dehydrogenase
MMPKIYLKEIIMPVFGWKAGIEQYPPMELLDYAVAAEQAGFDSIDVSDHFHPWSEDGQAAFTWTWLGAAAVKTSKITLGTGLTCPILRYHPAVVAQAAATLGCMAPGRAYLGVGTGEALNEYSATGQWPEYKTRQDMLAESIELMRQLFTGEDVTFEGDYYETHKARIFTRPEQPVPIYISALVANSATFAGKYGDGLMTAGGKEPEAYRELLMNFEDGAKSAGKDPKKMPRILEVNVAYTDDLDRSVEELKKYWAGTFVPAMFTERLYTAEMSAKNGEVVGNEIIKKHGCFSSDPNEHVKFIRQYLDAGFDQIFVHYPGPDQKGFIERYGRDVLTQLR